MNRVCQFCSERKVGCHATCEAYIKENEQNEKARKARYEHNAWLGYTQDVTTREIRRRRNHQ